MGDSDGTEPQRESGTKRKVVDEDEEQTADGPQTELKKNKIGSVIHQVSPFQTAPVAVDIGGSFTKMVYWRPRDPPDLPSYIIKEFQNGEPKLPLNPDPSLKVSIASGAYYVR